MKTKSLGLGFEHVSLKCPLFLFFPLKGTGWPKYVFIEAV